MIGTAFACADQVALMKQGQIVAIGAPADVITTDALKQLYGIDVAVAHLDAIGGKICAPVLNGGADTKTTSHANGVA